MLLTILCGLVGIGGTLFLLGMGVLATLPDYPRLRRLRCGLGLHDWQVTGERRVCSWCARREVFAGTYIDVDICDTRECELWLEDEA